MAVALSTRLIRVSGPLWNAGTLTTPAKAGERKNVDLAFRGSVDDVRKSSVVLGQGHLRSAPISSMLKGAQSLSASNLTDYPKFATRRK